MRIVHVDRDPQRSSRFERDVYDHIPRAEVVIAPSEERLERALTDDIVDCLVVAFDTSGSAAVSGDNLADPISCICNFLQRNPGTPVRVIADGEISLSELNRFMRLCTHMDVWGEGRSRPLIVCFEWTDIESLVADLCHQAEQQQQLRGVEIDGGPDQLFLRKEEKRLVRAFTRKMGGASCKVRDLAGGLSNSRVLGLDVRDEAGRQRISAVGRIADTDSIESEIAAYSNEVTRLPGNAYTPQVGVVRGNAKYSAAVFYRLVDGAGPLSDLILTGGATAAVAVTRLADLTKAWAGSAQEFRAPISVIRNRLIDSEDSAEVAEKYHLDWFPAVESFHVQVRESCIHGDLHSGNIFVSDDGQPILIDFGDVGVGSTTLDPIALELSLFCHPATSKKIKWWPDLTRAPWARLDEYIDGSPYSDFIGACRKWAHRVGGDKAVLASAYAYMLRQLKYADVDKDLAVALLNSISASLLDD